MRHNCRGDRSGATRSRPGGDGDRSAGPSPRHPAPEREAIWQEPPGVPAADRREHPPGSLPWTNVRPSKRSSQAPADQRRDCLNDGTDRPSQRVAWMPLRGSGDRRGGRSPLSHAPMLQLASQRSMPAEGGRRPADPARLPESQPRGHSSAGRAPALQAGGRRFEPGWLHVAVCRAFVGSGALPGRPYRRERYETGTRFPAFADPQAFGADRQVDASAVSNAPRQPPAAGAGPLPVRRPHDLPRAPAQKLARLLHAAGATAKGARCYLAGANRCCFCRGGGARGRSEQSAPRRAKEERGARR